MKSVPSVLRVWNCVAAALCAVVSASACSVPVFRYAIERWDPAPYELTVFHRGTLSSEQQGLLTNLSTNAPDDRVANVRVRTANIDSELSPGLAKLWAAHKTNTVPSLILRKPRGEGDPVWVAPLSSETISQAIDSPARRRISDRLLKGDSAVWVLVECGDTARDEAAAELLRARLAHLQKTLTLPEIAAEDITKHNISAAPEDLKVAFSLVRVSRADPAEKVLVSMLLNSEDDLDDDNEPLAFPVFGRGRTLFALVGKGINHETIDEACSFVIGPCSCVVKDLNPGMDLLLAANWGSVTRSDDEPAEAALLSRPRAGERVAIPPGNPPELTTSERGKWMTATMAAFATLVIAGALAAFTMRRRPLPR